MECTLCLDPFNDPRLLRCSHTFCRGCLENYLKIYVHSVESGTKFNCPVCRKEDILPQNGVDGVQKNYYLTESIAKENKPCYPVCPSHPDEDLRFYCRNCKTSICRDCQVVSHGSHDVDMVKNVVVKMTENIKDRLDATEKNINKNEIRQRAAIETDIESHESKLKGFKNEADRIKKNMDGVHDFISSLIKSACDRKKAFALKIEAESECKHVHINQFRISLSKAVENDANDVIFSLFKELVDEDNAMQRIKEESILSDMELSAKDEIDSKWLAPAFLQLTQCCLLKVREFKNLDFNQTEDETLTKRVSYLRMAEAVDDGRVNGVESHLSFLPNTNTNGNIGSSKIQQNTDTITTMKKSGYSNTSRNQSIGIKTNARERKPLNARTAADKYKCNIFGIDITSNGHLLLADYNNKTAKILSSDNQVLSSLSLSDAATDIVIINGKTVAVSTTTGKIHILDISDPAIPSVQRQLSLGYWIGGMTLCNNKLVVICWKSSTCVKMIDLNGHELWTVQLHLNNLWSVATQIFKNKTIIIVTDRNKDVIIGLDANNGNLIRTIDVPGKGPSGVTTDENGNVYVCYCNTREICVWSADLVHCSILEGVIIFASYNADNSPQSIVYNATTDEVFVGFPNDSVRRFQLG